VKNTKDLFRLYAKNMKMIRKIATLIILFSSIAAVSAQTSGRIDQFYLDPSVVNPAAMNMQQQGSVGLYYNKMYSAIPGSGQSTLLNVILPVPDKRTGFGFLYMREKVGFQQLHNAYFTYAYTLPLGDATNLHLGVSLGVLSQNFDANKAVYISQNDPVVRALLYSPSSTRADVRGSAMLQAGNFAGGIGFSRLVRPRFDYSYYNYKASYSLQNLTNLVLQYNIEFSDNFALKPSVQIMFSRQCIGMVQEKSLVGCHYYEPETVWFQCRISIARCG
jgi:type IX secretion system PorP/SprF family membrane protein